MKIEMGESKSTR